MTGQDETRGRRIYRWVWTLTWALVAAVGAVISLGRFGWPGTVGLAVIFGALASCWSWVSRTRRPGQQHGRIATAGAAGALAGAALAGWGAAVGGAAVAIPPTVLLTMPGLSGWLSQQPLLSAWRRRLIPGPQPDANGNGASRSSGPSSAAVAPPPQSPFLPEPTPQVPVRELTDAELCQAWRTSYVTLDRLLKTANTFQQARWITRRQQYLDELEQRNPHGFHRWLQSGARPAGDPSRYI